MALAGHMTLLLMELFEFSNTRQISAGIAVASEASRSPFLASIQISRMAKPARIVLQTRSSRCIALLASLCIVFVLANRQKTRRIFVGERR